MSDLAIEARDLTRTFGSFTAVDHITFDVRAGEVFGFLGANGAGKTTAIRMLTGLLTPSGGAAKVAGHDVYSESEAIKRTIGYMSQRFSLYEDLSPRENIRLYGGIYDLTLKEIRERSDQMLSRLGMAAAASRPVRELPLGWRQKLALSVALLHRPAIVFLDEPTSGVDPVTRRQFWELIYETARGGTTVLVTTHYMDEAEYRDRISIMVAGRIGALGTPAELKQQFAVPSIDEVFVRLARPEQGREQERGPDKARATAGGTEGVAGRTEGVAGRTEGVAGRTEGVAGGTEGVAGGTEGVAGRTEGVVGGTEGVAGETEGVARALSGPRQENPE